MGRVSRWVGVGALAAAVAAGGCAWARRPHADDPLLRDGRGVWGNLEKARTSDQLPAPEPVAPPAPPQPADPNPVAAADPVTSP